MIIDFHTHVFPDKIAEKTINYLMNKGGIKSYGNGSLASLESAMKKAETDLAVVMPVATNPKQFDSVNRFAAEISKREGIVSFGGIHPECSDIKEKLSFLKSEGFKGIKLHPDYQETYINDKKMLKLIETALGMDFYITIHAGLDPAYPDDIHCPPEQSAKMIEHIYGSCTDVQPRIILAHLGGYCQYDDAEKYLAGLPVYLDLAVILNHAPKEQIERMIKNHGADKILYASDFPWSDLNEDIEIFNSLKITDEDKEKILCRNACKILGIKQ